MPHATASCSPTGSSRRRNWREHYGLNDAELDALTNRLRPGTRAAIDAEIAEIEKRLRKDRRGYFKDEAAAGALPRSAGTAG